MAGVVWFGGVGAGHFKTKRAREGAASGCEGVGWGCVKVSPPPTGMG